MINHMESAQKNKYGGFTLIEMMVSLSIFILIILIVINVYIVINHSQRRTVEMQKLQSDTRYIFEAMTQEVRLGIIDYDFYSNASPPFDLHPDALADNYILALKDQSAVSIFFRRSGDDGDGTAIQYCEEVTTGDCELADGLGWQNVTPEGVRVTDLRFSITPSADPFAGVPKQSCDFSSGTGDDECETADLESYRCAVDNVCRYFTDGDNFQPKVRINLQVQGLDTTITEEGRTLTMETIISSRILQGSVRNENY